MEVATKDQLKQNIATVNHYRQNGAVVLMTLPLKVASLQMILNALLLHNLQAICFTCTVKEPLKVHIVARVKLNLKHYLLGRMCPFHTYHTMFRLQGQIISITDHATIIYTLMNINTRAGQSYKYLFIRL